MDDASPQPSPVADPALEARLESLTEEVTRLRAIVERAGLLAGHDPIEAAGPIDPAEVAEPVGRRAAIRRAATLAAGAVAGGAALVATTASPAAAATVTGSGVPGVSASGVSGDGLNATTNSSVGRAVYAHTATSGATAIFAQHTAGGVALDAQTSGGSSYTATISGTGTGTVLGVNATNGPVAVFTSNTSSIGMSVANSGVGPAMQIEALGGGLGLEVISPVGGNMALYVDGADTAVLATGVSIGGTFGGGQAALHLNPSSTTPPTQRTGPYAVGDLISDGTHLWYCITAGSPGSFRMLTASNAAGSLVVLPTPIRVYDSRPSTSPTTGPKTPLAPNVARTIDLTNNSSTVPAGATAAIITVLLVNAASGNGNFTLWANGVAKPASNTLVWGGSDGRFTAKELSAVDAQAKVQVSASLKTDVVLDVVGYYR